MLASLSLLMCLAAAAPAPFRPVHTYSIVARDAGTGDLGIAVQSHWFSVGAVVPWAEAGVGAVATQSGMVDAAILVVRGSSTGRPWADKLFDLRVEDSTEPLKELRRLVGVQRAYNHMSAGDDCVAAKDWTCAERDYGAAEAMQPANAEMAFWHGVALASNRKMDEARPLFQRAFAADARWRELVKRLPAVDQLPKDRQLMEQIQAVR
jgi:uncharacterized Ntn-hydrolase superfamily protein